MTPRTPTLLDREPTVAREGTNLVAVFEFTPGTTETLHRGAWLLVERVDAGAPHPETGEARVYLYLEGPGLVRAIDPETGIVGFVEKAGPILLSSVTTLRHARDRSVLEVDAATLAEVTP